MAKFRNPKSQAEHAVRKLSAIGESRHENHEEGKIHSLGTARNYEQGLKSFGEWLKTERKGDIFSADKEAAMQYLEMRSAEVRQPTLDQDRQAIQALLGEKRERVRSELETNLSTRAYTTEQLNVIRAAQTERNAIATDLAEKAGLRAHELHTLRPAGERPASSHRQWREDRFSGRDGERYTVTGKGGLIREVLVPHDLATRLEERRLAEPQTVTDRGIRYQKSYDIGGGQAWSQSFSRASERSLGRSQGGHGCRHSYAQERVNELQERGYSYNDAKEVVSQELGHFRADVIDAYLR
ncbi:MAG: site-specific integrase [Deltaproteobacteria bacterium]|nr:site-specific integrase [Deltaproteobacteria bacterium]